MAAFDEPLLIQAEAALAQGNYALAIAHFRTLSNSQPDQTTRSRAQRGLVEAYTKSGNPTAAIALCQQLLQSGDEPDRQWASEQLARLTASEAEVTGFVPAAATTVVNSPDQNQTSFVAGVNPNSQGTDPPTEADAGASQPSSQPQTTTSIPSAHKPQRKLPPVAPQKQTLLLLAGMQLVSAIALVGLLHWSIHWLIDTFNLISVEWLGSSFYLNTPYRLTRNLNLFLLLVVIASPVFLDGWLKACYRLEFLPLHKLAGQCPQTAKLLQRYCRQRKLPVPTLAILPTALPVIVTYGNFPLTTRIVFSQGLLAQLTDEELAAVLACQLGQIVHWSYPLLSSATALLLIPYTLYWQVAKWGEKLAQFVRTRLPKAIQLFGLGILAITALLANFCYGIFRGLQLPLLGFSRLRIEQSDRFAAQLTQDPNALSRALVKIADGSVQQIKLQQRTDWLLEGFALLLPLGYKQAIAVSNASKQIPVAEVLLWECTHPHRWGLQLLATHPLLGDRIAQLGSYATAYNLSPQFDLPALEGPATHPILKAFNLFGTLPLWQSALLIGGFVGVFLRSILWLVGKIGEWFEIEVLVWLKWADPLLGAFFLFAFSLTVVIGFNRYFCDRKLVMEQEEPSLSELLSDPNALPTNPQRVRLTGKLLGRAGVSNWLTQDLMLQTATGIIKLHYCSGLDFALSLFPFRQHPSEFVWQRVTIFGWFRRGDTTWIDVETLIPKTGKPLRNSYPIVLLVLALFAALWGTRLILRA